MPKRHIVLFVVLVALSALGRAQTLADATKNKETHDAQGQSLLQRKDELSKLSDVVSKFVDLYEGQVKAYNSDYDTLKADIERHNAAQCKKSSSNDTSCDAYNSEQGVLNQRKADIGAREQMLNDFRTLLQNQQDQLSKDREALKADVHKWADEDKQLQAEIDKLTPKK